MNPVTLFFGRLPTGDEVHAWTLANATGAKLQIIEYGGIVTRLEVPDRAGRYPDAFNVPKLGDIMVHPGKPKRGATVYAFSAE